MGVLDGITLISFFFLFLKNKELRWLSGTSFSSQPLMLSTSQCYPKLAMQKSKPFLLYTNQDQRKITLTITVLLIKLGKVRNGPLCSGYLKSNGCCYKRGPRGLGFWARGPNVCCHNIPLENIGLRFERNQKQQEGRLMCVVAGVKLSSPRPSRVVTPSSPFCVR